MACATRSPRGGTAFSTTAEVVSANRPTYKLAAIAARSTADGRHGISTKSEHRAASTAPPASRGAKSITASDAPALQAVSSARANLGGCVVNTGGSSPRRSPHTPADPCGSRSITIALPPASSCATARATAIVVFPLPPFWETRAIVRIVMTMITMIAMFCQSGPGGEGEGIQSAAGGRPRQSLGHVGKGWLDGLCLAPRH